MDLKNASVRMGGVWSKQVSAKSGTNEEMVKVHED